MLQADEVDADFFTPSTSTSLANIFKKTVTVVEEDKVNPSLKYIPQLPPTDNSKSEELRPTQCVFACALQTYEWLNNTYVAKGKLGFAILKVTKTGIHNIVLYDSKKVTISNATVTSNFEINVKENVSLSYYDNLRKYWSIYATQAELHQILEIVKSLGVNIKHSSESKDTDIKNSLISSEGTSTDKEDETSNTDSTTNRKTKNSILKRMANMGQSVLPNPIVINKNSTDSSDSNQICDKRKANKHKHLKTVSSRNHVDKPLPKIGPDFGVETNLGSQNIICSKNSNAFDNIHQIVPYTVSPIVKDIACDTKNIGSINDLSLLISEQRVSNSELRINLSKITDKLDLVLDKVKDGTKIESDSSSSNFQHILVQKLLNEYEMKIKKYEAFIKEKGLDCNSFSEDSVDNPGKLLVEKDNEISKLQNQISTLTIQLENSLQNENQFKNEITQLREDIALKNDQLINLKRKLEDTSDHFQKSDDAKNKIKTIMNDTYQSISASFNDDEDYSGANIKNIVAVVIKKTTIEAINDM